MSAKSRFKMKLPKLPFQNGKSEEPRKLEEINKDWQEAVVRQSDAHYRVFLFQQEAEKWNRRMQELSAEGHARQELDGKKAKETEEANKASREAARESMKETTNVES